MVGKVSYLVTMSTTINELQAFTHLTGFIGDNGDGWCIILQAGEMWVDYVPITDQERMRVYEVLRTPNLSTPVSEFIRALQ
jgi:hypothetical protein